MEQRSEQFLRKRKFLLVLPLLLLPFVCLAFWALGGGKGRDHLGQTGQVGINTSLPGARLTDIRPKDKLSLYEQRQADSAGAPTRATFGRGMGLDTAKVFGAGGLGRTVTADASEAKINEKLAEIRRAVREPEKVAAVGAVSPELVDKPGGMADRQAEKLQRLMQEMKDDSGRADPELKQLEGMMDKILLIQHPSSVRAKEPVKQVVPDSAFKAIPAQIDGNQKVLPGGLVRLRLADSVRVNGVLFLKGQSLSGSCTVTNQRLMLDIKSIRLGTSIVPVSLTVFSLDGLPGIDAPEAEFGEAAGGGAVNALDNMELLSMDQSVGIQAATAGISAAKGLLRKKVRMVRVKLHNGQMVLLRVNKS